MSEEAGAQSTEFVPLAPIGHVLVNAGLLWVVYCVCALGGTLVVMTGGGVNPTTGATAGAVLAALGAIVTATLGSFLFAAAAVRLQRAIREGEGFPRFPEGLRKRASSVVRRSERAALFFTLHGILGAVALLGFSFVISRTDWDRQTLLRATLILAFLDIGASFVLVLAASHLSTTLRNVHRDLAGPEIRRNRPPPNLLGFAYCNAAGAIALAVPISFLIGTPSPSTASNALCLLFVAGILGGIVAPAYGFAAFIRLIQFGLATG